MTVQQVRDIALIVLAVLGIIQGLVLLMLAVLLYRKLAPLLDSARLTINNIQGTTAFVAETAVSPLIRVIGFIIGVRAVTGRLGKFMKGKGGEV